MTTSEKSVTKMKEHADHHRHQQKPSKSTWKTDIGVYSRDKTNDDEMRQSTPNRISEF